MCVGQYSYLRVVVCCGDYILHLGENIVYTFFGCCTYYYNLPRWQPEAVDGGIVKITFHNKNNPSVSSAETQAYRPLCLLRRRLPILWGATPYTGEPMAKFDAMLKPTHNVYINL